jgi:membrane protein
VFNLFAAHSIQLRTSLLAYFADLLPTLAFQLLNVTATELAAKSGGEKLIAGIAASLWFISGGISSIISSLNVAFRVEESRSWFKVRAIALALALVISILILSALAIVLVSGSLVDWMGVQLHLKSEMIVMWKALQWPTAVLFVVFSYALIYHFGPNLHDQRWHWITPGSVFGAASWMAASVGFRFYLEFVNNYTVVFGSLGAAVILLVWLYVTGLAFLVGGEINASIDRAAGQGEASESAGL